MNQERGLEYDVVRRGWRRRRHFGISEELVRAKVQAVGERNEGHDGELFQLELVTLLYCPDDVGVDANTVGERGNCQPSRDTACMDPSAIQTQVQCRAPSGKTGRRLKFRWCSTAQLTEAATGLPIEGMASARR